MHFHVLFNFHGSTEAPVLQRLKLKHTDIQFIAKDHGATVKCKSLAPDFKFINAVYYGTGNLNAEQKEVL